MEHLNCVEETTESENPLQGGNNLVRSEDLREELQGISERFQRTETKDDAEAGNTSGQSKVTSVIVITLNLEFNSTCRKKKHFQFH